MDYKVGYNVELFTNENNEELCFEEVRAVHYYKAKQRLQQQLQQQQLQNSQQSRLSSFRAVSSFPSPPNAGSARQRVPATQEDVRATYSFEKRLAEFGNTNPEQVARTSTPHFTENSVNEPLSFKPSFATSNPKSSSSLPLNSSSFSAAQYEEFISPSYSEFAPGISMVPILPPSPTVATRAVLADVEAMFQDEPPSLVSIPRMSLPDESKLPPARFLKFGTENDNSLLSVNDKSSSRSNALKSKYDFQDENLPLQSMKDAHRNSRKAVSSHPSMISDENSYETRNPYLQRNHSASAATPLSVFRDEIFEDNISAEKDIPSSRASSLSFTIHEDTDIITWNPPSST